MKTSTGTGAFLVTYKGRDNSDYDGREYVWDLTYPEDAEACVYDFMLANDWDADAFEFSVQELSLDDLAELAASDNDYAQEAQEYLGKLKQLPQFA